MLRDADIRDDLCDMLEEKYGKVRFFEEFVMGKSRADIVVVTPDFMVGVEIKSDADSYVRLERQVKDYSRFYDYNILVVGASHGNSAPDHVPPFWGIITVEETGKGLDFYVLREPVKSPKLRLTNQMGFLWKSELAVIQKDNGLHKYPGKSKMFIKHYLMDNVDNDELKLMMLDRLFNRDYSIYRDKEQTDED